MLARRQHERELRGISRPAVRTQQPHPAVQHCVAAVAGHRKPQPHFGIRLGDDVLRMQMGDRGQPTERRRAAVVQPVPRVQRLRRLGVGRQHRVIGIQNLRQVQPGQHRGDLEPVQGEPLRRKAAALGACSRRSTRADAETRRSPERTSTSVAAPDVSTSRTATPSAGWTCRAAAAGQRVARRLQCAELHGPRGLDLQQRSPRRQTACGAGVLGD